MASLLQGLVTCEGHLLFLNYPKYGMPYQSKCCVSPNKNMCPSKKVWSSEGNFIILCNSTLRLHCLSLLNKKLEMPPVPKYPSPMSFSVFNCPSSACLKCLSAIRMSHCLKCSSTQVSFECLSSTQVPFEFQNIIIQRSFKKFEIFCKVSENRTWLSLEFSSLKL